LEPLTPRHNSEENFLSQFNDYVDEESSNQDVLPKQELLDKLIIMGYSQQVAKKALIMTKNEGIFKAIDMIPEIQADLKKSKEEQAKGKTLIDWSCPDCTFINMSNNLFCEVCELEAPETAYVTLSEEPKTKEIKEPEVPKKETPKLPPVKMSFSSAETLGHFTSLSTLNRQAPLIIGAIRSLDSLVNIYIKQYGYTKKFLNEYYKEDEATGTLTCGVTGRTLLYPNEKSLS
jgi:uncharacterized Zn finger protein (UPF0148 family)